MGHDREIGTNLNDNQLQLDDPMSELCVAVRQIVSIEARHTLIHATHHLLVSLTQYPSSFYTYFPIDKLINPSVSTLSSYAYNFAALADFMSLTQPTPLKRPKHELGSSLPPRPDVFTVRFLHVNVNPSFPNLCMLISDVTICTQLESSADDVYARALALTS